MKDINFLKENNVDVNKCLELFGDIETYNETIKEFQKSIDGKLDKLENYYEDGDMANYAIYAHSLKSDCKYFGFIKLASIAYEHEMKGKANDIAYVRANFESFMEEAKKVKAIVNEYLWDASETEALYENVEAKVPEEPEQLCEDIILVADDSEVIRIFVNKFGQTIFSTIFGVSGTAIGNGLF